MGTRSCQAEWLVRYIPCLLKWCDSSVWRWNLSKFSHGKFDSCHYSLELKRLVWTFCYKQSYSFKRHTGEFWDLRWMFLTMLQYGYFSQKWILIYSPSCHLQTCMTISLYFILRLLGSKQHWLSLHRWKTDNTKFKYVLLCANRSRKVIQVWEWVNDRISFLGELSL